MSQETPSNTTLLIRAASGFDDLAYGERPANEVARVVRGGRCSDKRRLLQEFAAALQFPHYFGNNWDAFDECMNDLSWIKGSRLVLLIVNFSLPKAAISDAAGAPKEHASFVMSLI